MTLTGVCLALAASTAATLPIAGESPRQEVFVRVERFTLAWVHSIEQVRWEEDYAVVEVNTAGAPLALRATAARVRGSAAGMEPPADARLRNGWYEYAPVMHTPGGLRLTRSDFAADYQWCTDGTCRPMSDLLPSDGGVTRLWACRRHDSR